MTKPIEQLVDEHLQKVVENCKIVVFVSVDGSPVHGRPLDDLLQNLFDRVRELELQAERRRYWWQK
ncbi:hypothetical protein [Jiangella anatolica]|uniref:Uncharacterized protein n=1 Tax=Jiangella anatolica TaxID=2670374 RepID=A0A2W2BTB5_9ACTN|nr:hypothetical protein [Jiangella anatolica]PZF83228.1 hypothetical protein C1I92_13200 [Jiangella anatolica]